MLGTVLIVGPLLNGLPVRARTGLAVPASLGAVLLCLAVLPVLLRSAVKSRAVETRGAVLRDAVILRPGAVLLRPVLVR